MSNASGVVPSPGTEPEMSFFSLDSAAGDALPTDALEAPGVSKKKKKKKRKSAQPGDSAAASDSDNDASSDSGHSSASSEGDSNDGPPAEMMADINKQFGMALEEARKGEEEIISLDGLYLKNTQVKKVIAALKGNAQTMTLVLSNNRISDAGCIALATALSESAFCPQLLSLDLRGNARVSEAGVRILKDATLARPNLQAWTGTTTGAQDPDAENMEEVFKQVTLQEESMESVAQPSEQWDALRVALHCTGPSACSRISEVMRDITDSVTNELVKEVAVEAAGEGATSIVVASRQMDQSPSLYALYAVTQLDALHLVLDIVPPPYQSTCSQKLIAGVGSHRFHASALVCCLVRTACNPELGKPLLSKLIASQLLPKVVHLAISHPNSSCMHGAVLDAYSEETLVNMKPQLWRPLLLPNFGLPADRPPKELQALPETLLSHATTALRQTVGQRSGLVGLVINLASVFQAAAQTNAEIKQAFDQDTHWTQLLAEKGPLGQLQSEQAGSLGGGKPAVLGQDVIVDETASSPSDFSRVMFGIREFSAMHQSLNLAVALN